MTKCLQHCASQGWEAPLYAGVDLMRNEESENGWCPNWKWWNRNCGSDLAREGSSDLGTGLKARLATSTHDRLRFRT